MFKTLKKSTQDRIENIIIVMFFIFIFTNSVLAYNIDYSRVEDNSTSAQFEINSTNTSKLNLDSIPNNSNPKSCYNLATSSPVSSGLSTDPKTISDSGAGCYTVELPEESVNKIWNDILVNGFVINNVGSDKTANSDRPKLENNDVLLTNSSSKAGDSSIKKEMPDKIIDPEETPTLLGQNCYGPFSYGVNLTENLRIGRCKNTDTNDGCYVREDGLFRQNGVTGFFKELNTIKKDALDWLYINKLNEEISGKIDPSKQYTSNVDLGAFSDMSAEELADFKALMEDSNKSDVKIEQMQVLKGKMVKNVFETDNFRADMETTCIGDNCYINMYSLFDKMFNQYLSADMVYSSASPVLWNSVAGLLKNNAAFKRVTGTGYDKWLDDLRKNKKLTPGSYMDNLLSNKEALNSPIKALYTAKKKTDLMKDIDKFKTNMDLSGSRMKTIFENYKIQPEVETVFSKFPIKKDVSATMKEYLAKGGTLDKLSPTEKRAYYRVMENVEEQISIGNAIAQNITVKDSPFDKAKQNYLKAFSSHNEATYLDRAKSLATLNIEELKALRDGAEAVQKVSHGINKAYFKSSAMKWDADYDKLGVFTQKNKVQFKSGGQADMGKLGSEYTESIFNWKLDKVTDNEYNFGLKLTDEMKFDTFDITLTDGKIIHYKVPFQVDYVPDKSKMFINPTTVGLTHSPALMNNIDGIVKANPNLMIEYYDAAGEYKTMFASDFDPAIFPVGTNRIGVYAANSNIKMDPAAPTRALVDDKTVDPINVLLDYADSDYALLKLKDGATSASIVTGALKSREWVSGRSRDWINMKMNAYNGPVHQRFLLWQPQMTALNLWYWELKTGFNTAFGET
ncbi:MAG: hypothetical protein V1824_00300, partial [archaeon]